LVPDTKVCHYDTYAYLSGKAVCLLRDDSISQKEEEIMNVVQQMMPQYQITQADKKRQADIAYAWRAYCGELDPPLLPMDDQPDDNIIDSLEDKIEALKDFLFGKELGIMAEESAPDAAQALIDATWGEKETRMPLLQELAINGMLAGQAFLRIVPQRDGSLRLVAQDPACVFVRTAPQDCKTPLLYCIEYCEEEQIAGNPMQIYYREEMQRIDPQMDNPDSGTVMAAPATIWQIQHWTRIGDQGQWTPAGDVIPWKYPFPPLFTNQNMVRPNSFWGKPTVTKALIKLIEAYNISCSNTQKMIRLLATAILWARGTGLTDVDYSPGHITILSSPDAELGAVQIPVDFPGMQAQNDRLLSRIDEQSGVPGLATGRASAMPGGNMSGIAIELLFMSMIKRMDTMRCLYGEMILDVSKALLILKNFSPDIKITLNWQNPLPNDDTASWQAALLEKQVGVSDQTILEERGYDPEQEMERNQTEDAQKMINFSRGQGMPPTMQPQMQGDQGASTGQEQSNDSPFIGRGQ
jgi:Phage portal protein, SPP1 Gp6-like